jgi:DNA modification methylase
MVNYICETCGKSFKQKGHYTKHLQKKVPCENIKDKIEQMVEEKIEQLVDNGSIEINKNLISKYNTNTQTNIMDIQNIDGMQYLSEIDNNSIDLVLTDPPYITSSETGMGNLHKTIQENKEKGIEFVKTEEEWNKVKDKYIGKKNMPEETMKQNYMKFGSIFGSKYSVQTEYGEWDTSFTMDKLDEFIEEYYKKLKKGGAMIIFFDIWKITPLKELMVKHKFKQIRFIEWIKTNPQPLNSSLNYLTNCREIALLGVKGGKPTFNSKYDNAIYQFPLQGGKHRFHPTQKSLLLFEELIKKHSDVDDIVLDTFLGSGTTARACRNTNRRFKGCEVSKEYYDKLMELV